MQSDFRYGDRNSGWQKKWYYSQAVQRLVAEFERWVAVNEARLLQVKDSAWVNIVERTRQGRKLMWPKDGFKGSVLGRFLWHFYETHRGIYGHEDPCISMLRTVERNLHMGALRRCDFDNLTRRRCVV